MCGKPKPRTHRSRLRGCWSWGRRRRKPPGGPYPSPGRAGSGRRGAWLRRPHPEVQAHWAGLQGGRTGVSRSLSTPASFSQPCKSRVAGGRPPDLWASEAKAEGRAQSLTTMLAPSSLARHGLLSILKAGHSHASGRRDNPQMKLIQPPGTDREEPCHSSRQAHAASVPPATPCAWHLYRLDCAPGKHAESQELIFPTCECDFARTQRGLQVPALFSACSVQV